MYHLQKQTTKKPKPKQNTLASFGLGGKTNSVNFSCMFPLELSGCIIFFTHKPVSYPCSLLLNTLKVPIFRF